MSYKIDRDQVVSTNSHLNNDWAVDDLPIGAELSTDIVDLLDCSDCSSNHTNGVDTNTCNYQFLRNKDDGSNNRTNTQIRLPTDLQFVPRSRTKNHQPQPMQKKRRIPIPIVRTNFDTNNQSKARDEIATTKLAHSPAKPLHDYDQNKITMVRNASNRTTINNVNKSLSLDLYESRANNSQKESMIKSNRRNRSKTEFDNRNENTTNPNFSWHSKMNNNERTADKNTSSQSCHYRYSPSNYRYRHYHHHPNDFGCFEQHHYNHPYQHNHQRHHSDHHRRTVEFQNHDTNIYCHDSITLNDKQFQKAPLLPGMNQQRPYFSKHDVYDTSKRDAYYQKANRTQHNSRTNTTSTAWINPNFEVERNSQYSNHIPKEKKRRRKRKRAKRYNETKLGSSEANNNKKQNVPKRNLSKNNITNNPVLGELILVPKINEEDENNSLSSADDTRNIDSKERSDGTSSSESSAVPYQSNNFQKRTEMITCMTSTELKVQMKKKRMNELPRQRELMPKKQKTEQSAEDPVQASLFMTPKTAVGIDKTNELDSSCNQKQELTILDQKITPSDQSTFGNDIATVSVSGPGSLIVEERTKGDHRKEQEVTCKTVSDVDFQVQCPIPTGSLTKNHLHSLEPSNSRIMKNDDDGCGTTCSLGNEPTMQLPRSSTTLRFEDDNSNVVSGQQKEPLSSTQLEDNKTKDSKNAAQEKPKQTQFPLPVLTSVPKTTTVQDELSNRRELKQDFVSSTKQTCSNDDGRDSDHHQQQQHMGNKKIAQPRSPDVDRLVIMIDSDDDEDCFKNHSITRNSGDVIVIDDDSSTDGCKSKHKEENIPKKRHEHKEKDICMKGQQDKEDDISKKEQEDKEDDIPKKCKEDKKYISTNCSAFFSQCHPQQSSTTTSTANVVFNNSHDRIRPTDKTYSSSNEPLNSTAPSSSNIFDKNMSDTRGNSCGGKQAPRFDTTTPTTSNNNNNTTKRRSVIYYPPPPSRSTTPYYNYELSEEDACQIQEQMLREAAERVFRANNNNNNESFHTTTNSSNNSIPPGTTNRNTNEKRTTFPVVDDTTPTNHYYYHPPASAAAKRTREPPVFTIPLIDIAQVYPYHWQWNNPYSCLGLPFHASKEQVKSQFRKLAKLYHPDKQLLIEKKKKQCTSNTTKTKTTTTTTLGNDYTPEKFLAISKAYQSICNLL